jgi:hypothetical protein
MGHPRICVPTHAAMRLRHEWGTQEFCVPTHAAMRLRHEWGTQNFAHPEFASPGARRGGMERVAEGARRSGTAAVVASAAEALDEGRTDALEAARHGTILCQAGCGL